MTPPAPQDSTTRVGLALSGGGFRASLFHLGVLARLAELDQLRDVEVLSTVSGGSIIGALYYLHVRTLLQSKPDEAITRDDYVQLVDRLWRDFTVAIRANLRMQAFADAGKNRRMMRQLKYSRSDRMAELYEQYLYDPAVERTAARPLELPALTIKPCDMPRFHPYRRIGSDGKTNADRVHKVPVLVLNATTLNTGHTFQFTATWMGEPPAQDAYGDLDRNLRLRRAHYFGPDGLSEKYQKLPLAVAVAASAAVPGIFPPLALTGLYTSGEQPFTPQLVDGGVHDNQGIEGLLDPDYPCTHVIVSDASGQLEDVPNPVTGIGNVLRRSNEALMDRVRDQTYARLTLLKQQGAIRQLVLLHLKQDLPQRELAPGGDGRFSTSPPTVLSHGVHIDVQECLAQIRTDLDAFTEIEAHALIADGYLIAADNLRARFRDLPAGAGGTQPAESSGPVEWGFLDVRPYLEDPCHDREFVVHLSAARRRFGKTWQVVAGRDHWPLTVTAGSAGLVLAAGAGALWWYAAHWLLVAGLVLAATAGAQLLARVWRNMPVERALRWFHAFVPGLLTSSLMAWVVRRHLRVWTPLRLRYGRMKRLRPVASALPAAGQREAA